MEWLGPILTMNGSSKNKNHNKSGCQKVLPENEGDFHLTGKGCWKESLEKIASCRPEEAILRRDPMQSDSYNRNSLEEISLLQQVLTNLEAQQVQTFSMFGGGKIIILSFFYEIMRADFSLRFFCSSFILRSLVKALPSYGLTPALMKRCHGGK